MTADDIAAHRGDWVEPISTTYRGVEVATIPPNSQGITALMALNVLSILDWPMDAPIARLHAQIEAIKVAWSERDRCVADPDRGLADPAQLLSPEHARWLASRMSPDEAHRYTPTNPPGGGTVYLCAADGDGMMVSLIESNYMGFGSGVMCGSTGIMLQNRGAYFSLDPSHPNALAPRSRPLHTLMPGMLLRDGRAEVALGAMGGDGQPQTMVQLVTGLVDDGLGPQAVVDRPRWVVSTEGPGQPLGPVSLESDGWDAAAVDALEALGHDVDAHRAAHAGDGLGAGDPSPAGRFLRGRRRPARRLSGSRAPVLSETGSSAGLRSGPARGVAGARTVDPLRTPGPSPKARVRLRIPAPRSEEARRDPVCVWSASLLVCESAHLSNGPLKAVFPHSFS